MPRFRMTVEYDGGPYAGFQRQADLPTVQGAIEAAALAMSGEVVTVHAAGRTDAGVHATGQVIHIDLLRDWRPDTVRDALNAHMTQSDQRVAILDCMRADDNFHARFSAIRRHYSYRILDRRAPAALDAGRVWHVRRRLDLGPMREAAALLLGRHDFTTFRAAQCQSASPVKTLDRLELDRTGDEVEVRADARSFLHSQVRSMVGALKLVGEGKWTPEDVAASLAARNRARCAPLAPPGGLYLTRVDYSDDAVTPPERGQATP